MNQGLSKVDSKAKQTNRKPVKQSVSSVDHIPRDKPLNPGSKKLTDIFLWDNTFLLDLRQILILSECPQSRPCRTAKGTCCRHHTIIIYSSITWNNFISCCLDPKCAFPRHVAGINAMSPLWKTSLCTKLHQSLFFTILPVLLHHHLTTTTNSTIAGQLGGRGEYSVQEFRHAEFMVDDSNFQ